MSSLTFAFTSGRIYPCIYALLGNKTTITYRKFWSVLKGKAPLFDPLTATMDFEMANIKAIKEQFPSVSLQGCMFHLGQRYCLLHFSISCHFLSFIHFFSMWRQVTSLGLRREYMADEESRLFIKMILALAFVPPEDVVTGFNALVTICPDSLADLMDYFEV